MTQKESFLRCNLDFASVFKDKNYLVTGATSGIGYEVTKELLSLGANVTMTGRNAEKINKTTSSFANLKGKLYVIECDFSSAERTSELIKNSCIEQGPFHGCFHSAGIEMIKPVRMTKDSDVEKILSPTFYGAVGISKAFASKGVAMEGASIVFMSSIASLGGKSGLCLYSSTRASIKGLVRSLACELSSRQIRVNSIMAGAIQTEMHARILDGASKEVINSYLNMHPLGFGDVSDVSNAALFLLSKYSKWITGTDLVVDGGYLCQ